MTPAAPRHPFAVLAIEAILDAVRRRVVAAIAVALLVCLWFAESCTSCAAGSFRVNAQPVDPESIRGWTGILLYGAFALWTVAVAGILASDHLAQTLRDGSAVLALARPVGRATFALARLAGALAASLAPGAVLLGMTALFLRVRHDLPLAPAAGAAAACALGALAIAALAMSVSLVLPRIASFLLVLAAVGSIAVANLASLLGAELSGVPAALDRFGPPLATAIALAVAPWSGQAPAAAGSAEVSLRLLAWGVAGVALLAFAFRRVEIALEA